MKHLIQIAASLSMLLVLAHGASADQTRYGLVGQLPVFSGRPPPVSDQTIRHTADRIVVAQRREKTADLGDRQVRDASALRRKHNEQTDLIRKRHRARSDAQRGSQQTQFQRLKDAQKSERLKLIRFYDKKLRKFRKSDRAYLVEIRAKFRREMKSLNQVHKTRYEGLRDRHQSGRNSLKTRIRIELQEIAKKQKEEYATLQTAR